MQGSLSPFQGFGGMTHGEKRPEKELYPLVEQWLRGSHFRCFTAAINKGLRHGRVDVVGVRDIGGDLSGDVEIIAIEVKKGSTPFANASGQTVGYRVYANRVYLADVRENSFSYDEVMIASHLGIGLIEIRNGECQEVLSSPCYQPLEKLRLLLLEALGLGKCQLCNSVFKIGNAESGNRWSNLTREKVRQAIEKERGLMFWNREVADRKKQMGIRDSRDGSTYERRFICPDCMWYFFSQLSHR